MGRRGEATDFFQKTPLSISYHAGEVGKGISVRVSPLSISDLKTLVGTHDGFPHKRSVIMLAKHTATPHHDLVPVRCSASRFGGPDRSYAAMVARVSRPVSPRFADLEVRGEGHALMPAAKRLPRDRTSRSFRRGRGVRDITFLQCV